MRVGYHLIPCLEKGRAVLGWRRPSLGQILGHPEPMRGKNGKVDGDRGCAKPLETKHNKLGKVCERSS